MELHVLILTVVLSLLFLSYAVFAYRYARHSPWNATWQGVTLLSQKVTMAALVAFFIVDNLAPDGYWPGRYSLLMILLTLLLVEAVATLVGLLHVQRTRGPVSRRQGTGYVPADELVTDPRRVTTINPEKESDHDV